MRETFLSFDGKVVGGMMCFVCYNCRFHFKLVLF